MDKHKYAKIIKETLEWTRDIVIAVVIALLITRFVITHTVIPTGSMIPTIGIDDHLIINRVPYYFTDPKAGEIVIFHQEKELIKRVVAVPGDVLDLRDGDVYINGEKLDEPYLNEPNSTYSFFMDDIQFPLEIPEDKYFVMGDNRGNSEDSRYFGFVNRKQIYAKSGLRIWPLNRIGFLK